MAANRNTRLEILEIAEEMLQSRSFNCFSFQHISARLGIRKASLYHHFPSKSNLGLALIERYRSQFRSWCEELDTSTDGPMERLQAYIDHYETCLDGNQICPGGVLAAEFNAISPEMQSALRDLFDDNHRWLTSILEEGRQAGVFEYPGSPAEQATLVSVAIQGALQQGRACGREKYEMAMAQLKRAMLA